HHRRGDERDSAARHRAPAADALVSDTLGERGAAGDPRAIARALSLVGDDDPSSAALGRSTFGRTGRAHLVGVTGPPGAGKSTLVDRLVSAVRTQSPRSSQNTQTKIGSADSADSADSALCATLCGTVGVIAVDPTSPFSGGAVLGDRLRMQA